MQAVSNRPLLRDEWPENKANSTGYYAGSLKLDIATIVLHITDTPVALHFFSTFVLYIHVGSPNVNSLTHNNRSRTLTCTSTGGPATTVTWRRDRVVITLSDTYQQTKRLVDAETGTYQTVLTINSSVGWSDIVGTYNCTVGNDRGESSEIVVVTGED